ncbi:hypothetical protein [Rudanella lutea]|jgi:predicted P-loop ATPase/GTPase|uniref:hypothetical protein n=1 Tax=Rudanella lutea TaxID=451374 RepID=UPI00035E9E24|nr:hypothetical protein [Rudanella lutea]
MQTILVQPRNQEELQLVTQLMKRMKIRASLVEETPKQRKKREILDSLERSVDEMNAYLRGEVEMKSADDFLKEL